MYIAVQNFNVYLSFGRRPIHHTLFHHTKSKERFRISNSLGRFINIIGHSKWKFKLLEKTA